MIVNGYVWLLVTPFVCFRFFKEGTVSTKWGIYTGDSAIVALVGYILLALLFGYYSIKETITYFNKN